MHTRSTSDYGTLRGPIMNDNGRDVSGRTRHERQQYEQAVNARAEMLKLFEHSRPNEKQNKPVRKTWAQRMEERNSMFRADADLNYRSRNGNYMKHKIKKAA